MIFKVLRPSCHTCLLGAVQRHLNHRLKSTIRESRDQFETLRGVSVVAAWVGLVAATSSAIYNRNVFLKGYVEEVSPLLKQLKEDTEHYQSLNKSLSDKYLEERAKVADEPVPQSEIGPRILSEFRTDVEPGLPAAHYPKVSRPIPKMTYEDARVILPSFYIKGDPESEEIRELQLNRNDAPELYEKALITERDRRVKVAEIMAVAKESKSL